MRAPESEGLPSACVILNAANEICVELFLDGRISWTEIAMYVRKAMEELGGVKLESAKLPAVLPTTPQDIAALALEMGKPIMELDHQVRNFVLKAATQQALGK